MAARAPACSSNSCAASIRQRRKLPATSPASSFLEKVRHASNEIVCPAGNSPGRAGAQRLTRKQSRLVASLFAERQRKLRRVVSARFGAEWSRAEIVLGADSREALPDFAAILFWSISRARIPGPILFQELWKSLLQEWEELLLRRWHQEDRFTQEPLRPRIARRARQRVQVIFPVCEDRENRRGEDARGNARVPQGFHGCQAQVRPRSARLEQTSQSSAQGCHGDVDENSGARGNALQHINVADHLVGLCCDGDAQSFAQRHLFEDRARGAELALGRLIGIGGSANGDVFRRRGAGCGTPEGVTMIEIPRQERAGVLLDEDLVVEFPAVKLHVLVRIARVTIAAGEFAPAVRIDGPLKRDAL